MQNSSKDIPTDKPLLIALDGPVSSGKSSLADAVAKRLGILHLDTGAMYRAVGLAALRLGIDPGDEQAVTNMIADSKADVDVRFMAGKQQTLLNGIPVDDAIRSQQAGSAASAVSRYAQVRRYLVLRQQAIAQHQSMIVDGRDIGTVVLPQAKAKIFILASPQVRAERRYRQLLASGDTADKNINYESVLEELQQRDHQDMQRENDPLRPADGAVQLDTSHLTFEGSVEAIVAIANEVYGKSS